MFTKLSPFHKFIPACKRKVLIWYVNHNRGIKNNFGKRRLICKAEIQHGIVKVTNCNMTESVEYNLGGDTPFSTYKYFNESQKESLIFS